MSTSTTSGWRAASGRGQCELVVRPRATAAAADAARPRPLDDTFLRERSKASRTGGALVFWGVRRVV